MDIFTLREMYLKNNRKNINNEQSYENKSIETVENKSIETVENKSIDMIDEPKSENINELFEILSKKINNIEMIDESLIIEIYDRLKFIKKNHNNKILSWYDDKFNADLNEFKKNNNSFYNLMKFNEQNSFVLIENN